MNEFLWYALIFPFVLYIGLRSIERWVLPRFRLPDGSLEAKEADLRRQVENLQRKNTEIERKNTELEANQALLLKELGRANAKISEQNDKIAQLSSKVKEMERTVPITPVEAVPFMGRVLGVWPDALPLDTVGERRAISTTGLEYEALEGDAATRMGIIEQLSQREYRIMEIGAKGGEVGIKLKDGIAPPEWWTRLAKQHSIDIFVVLSNESSKPGVVNVADALFNAGADAVVSVDSKISDIDAVRFATMFYRRLSRGVPLDKAVDYAKLVISDSGSDTIKLRTR